MRYRYTFLTLCRFEPSVRLHSFKLRVLPMESAVQHVLESHVSVTPCVQLCQSTDAFGNAILYGTLRESHEQFVVCSEGRVEKSSEPLSAPSPAPYYHYVTALTAWDASLPALCQGRSPADLMHVLHSRLQYERFVTDNSTTALQALTLGRGVCQDYAHLMIAGCRAVGYAARYVGGLVEGEGETPAWEEVHEGGCWHACDPTPDSRAGEGFLKIAHGRDASDCPVNRGRFYQWTSEIMEVKCKVTHDTDSDFT